MLNIMQAGFQAVAQMTDQPPMSADPGAQPVENLTVEVPHVSGSSSILSELLIMVLIGFWLWMLVDVAKRRYDSDSEKIAWLLIVLILNVLGAVVYAVAGRSRGRMVNV